MALLKLSELGRPSPILYLFLIFPTACPIWAQFEGDFPPPEAPQVIQASRVTGPISVDGILDEPDWLRAAPIDDFFRIEPKQGGTYDFKTEVRILFDDKNLHIGVFCADSMGKRGIRVQDFRRDFLSGENDAFLLQLDPQNLRRYCVSFQTTPLGTQRDAQVFDDAIVDSDWDALWTVKTSVAETGWTAEFSIPFKSLRYVLPPKGEEASWGFTASRLARRTYEQTVFPPIPQTFTPYRMTYAAQLQGLELPKPGLNLRINPYQLYSYERQHNELNTQSTATPKLGADIKWAISSHAVLDLTVNTDFAQADVDRAVNNLTRFNVFFPERRQFFLENSGIFPTSGGKVAPYFSRAIGLSDSQFNAEPVAINAGVRFNDRNDNRTWSGLYVNQRATETQGVANFALVRFQQNFGRQNNFGALITHRYDAANNNASSNHNTTFTADLFMRPNDNLTVNFMMTGSQDEGTGKFGHAGSLFTGLRLINMYAGYLGKWVSPDYLPGMGFTFGQDVAYHSGGGYYIWRPKKENSLVRRSDPGAFVNYYHNVSDGGFQQLELYLFPIYQWFRDNSFVEFAATPTWQNINFPFAPLNIIIPQDTYFYTRYRLRYNSDQSRQVSGLLKAEFGNFYNGRLLTLNTGARIAPSPHAALTIDYELNQAKALGEENVDKNVHLYSGGLRLARNAQLQGTVFYQFNSLDKTGRWNARLSWEYQPLSFLFLVLNDTRSDLGLNRFQNTGIIAKINWMKQF